MYGIRRASYMAGKKHKSQLSTNDSTQLNKARMALGDLFTEDNERNVRFLKQRYYEHGSNASKLLAFQIKKQGSQTVVQKIKQNDPEKPFLYKPVLLFSTIIYKYIL